MSNRNNMQNFREMLILRKDFVDRNSRFKDFDLEDSKELMNGIIESDVEIEDIIGIGNVSVVYKARVKGDTYALRVFDTFLFKTEETFESFVEELRKDFDHTRKVSFHGIVFMHNYRKLGVLSEYCSGGTVKEYLMNEDNPLLTTTQKLRLLHELADIMSYLEANDFVHGSLCWENVLLTNELGLKLKDLGISKHLEVKKNSTFVHPEVACVQAPEVTLSMDYRSKNDVFAFGIMMYMIITGDFEPYERHSYAVHTKVALNPDIRPEIMEKKVFEREEMRWLAELAQSCWVMEADSRPTFDVIMRKLEEHMEETGEKMKPFDEELFQKEKERKEMASWYMMRQRDLDREDDQDSSVSKDDEEDEYEKQKKEVLKTCFTEVEKMEKLKHLYEKKNSCMSEYIRSRDPDDLPKELVLDPSRDISEWIEVVSISPRSDVYRVRCVGKPGVLALKMYNSRVMFPSVDSFFDFEKRVREASTDINSRSNLVQVHGVVFLEPMVGVLMEDCSPMRDLKSYIMNKTNPRLTLKEKLGVVEGIAIGMKMLQNQPKGGIQSRKILLKRDEEEVLHSKLMELDLRCLSSLQCHECQYFSPEFTLGVPNEDSKSGVYSFGMVMYEILTENFFPYGQALEFNVELRVALNPDYRPPIDTHILSLSPALRWYVKLMKKCWDVDRIVWPEVTELVDILGSHIPKCLKSWEGKQSEYFQENNVKLTKEMVKEKKFVEVNLEWGDDSEAENEGEEINEESIEDIFDDLNFDDI